VATRVAIAAARSLADFRHNSRLHQAAQRPFNVHIVVLHSVLSPDGHEVALDPAATSEHGGTACGPKRPWLYKVPIEIGIPERHVEQAVRADEVGKVSGKETSSTELYALPHYTHTTKKPCRPTQTGVARSQTIIGK